MHRRLRKPNENPQVANNSDNIEIFESRRANIQEKPIKFSENIATKDNKRVTPHVFSYNIQKQKKKSVTNNNHFGRNINNKAKSDFEKAREKLNYQKALESLNDLDKLKTNKENSIQKKKLEKDSSRPKLEKEVPLHKLTNLMSKVVDEGDETLNCMWDSSIKKQDAELPEFDINDFQNGSFLNKNLDMPIELLNNDNEYRTLDHDFKNLQILEESENNEKSLNLGSEYSNNEYQFDDKVSSVQRDLSLENCTDEYNSILNSSDLSNSENNKGFK